MFTATPLHRLPKRLLSILVTAIVAAGRGRVAYYSMIDHGTIWIVTLIDTRSRRFFRVRFFRSGVDDVISVLQIERQITRFLGA
jgi:drug/metabolite transporter (DMT)-like permease